MLGTIITKIAMNDKLHNWTSESLLAHCSYVQTMSIVPTISSENQGVGRNVLKLYKKK